MFLLVCLLGCFWWLQRMKPQKEKDGTLMKNEWMTSRCFQTNSFLEWLKFNLNRCSRVIRITLPCYLDVLMGSGLNDCHDCHSSWTIMTQWTPRVRLQGEVKKNIKRVLERHSAFEVERAGNQIKEEEPSQNAAFTLEFNLCYFWWG